MINISIEDWNKTQPSPLLRDREVHLWRVELERDRTETDLLFELLSDDECERANKYRFSKDRSHFVVGRATLRKIIGGYLGVSPEKIVFSIRHYGKPYLSGVDRDLRFNVTHSNGVAVIAVTKGRELGVDIEFFNPEFDIFSVAPSVFTSIEVSHLRSLAANLQTAVFFAGWTRKEAFLKAMGDGLSSSNELQPAVSFFSDEDVSFDLLDNGRKTKWSLTSFLIQDDFKAALAVEGKMRTFSFYKLIENVS